MSKTIITNTAHSGYRRAGICFVSGVNTLETSDISAQQLAQIRDDSRLVVQGAEKSASGDQANHSQTAQGHVEQHSLADVVGMIKALDKDDPSVWKQDSTPKASAFPRGVSAELRETAWQSVLDEIENTPVDKA